MERAWAVLEGIGVAPLGFRAPSADLSEATLALVEELGFLYDSSLMTDDYRPFHPRIGDRVTRGVPLERGRESSLWELPLSFELDDWVHFQFNFDPYRKGGATPADVLEIWSAELDWMNANVDGGGITSSIGTAIVGDQQIFLFVDSYPSLASWAAATEALQNSDDLDDLFTDLNECSDSRLWRMEDTE